MSAPSVLGSLGPVGFIGLGLLGQAMALRLSSQGVRLVVWNREPERLDALAAAGATVAASPRDVAQHCAVICTCVLDARAVTAVMFEAEGLVHAPHRDRVVIDFSTVDPDDTRAIAMRAGEARVDWIDAPVSGGPSAAADGTLTLMVGGKTAAVNRVRVLLDLLAKNVTHVGDTGAGQAMKVVNQAIVGGTFVMLAEALALVRSLGLPADLVPVCLRGGLADSVALQRIWTRMVTEDYLAPTGRAAQMLKDLKNVVAIHRAAGLELPLIQAAAQQYTAYVDDGWGNEETVSIARLYAFPRVSRDENGRSDRD
jgi:3-hydroxyisobutyrate dehydrogenase-like beta-hydroxyacid dehydrogenase